MTLVCAAFAAVKETTIRCFSHTLLAACQKAEPYACVLLFHLFLREGFAKATMMVSKMKRGSGEAVVERSHQALVPSLLEHSVLALWWW